MGSGSKRSHQAHLEEPDGGLRQYGVQGERGGPEDDEELLPRAEDPGQLTGGVEEPPAWWNKAWKPTGYKMDHQRRHMTDKVDRMFTVRSQRTDSLEHRLEIEAWTETTTMQALVAKVMAESLAMIANTARSAENINAIEEVSNTSMRTGGRGRRATTAARTCTARAGVELGHRAMLLLGMAAEHPEEHGRERGAIIVST